MGYSREIGLIDSLSKNQQNGQSTIVFDSTISIIIVLQDWQIVESKLVGCLFLRRNDSILISPSDSLHLAKESQSMEASHLAQLVHFN